MSSINAVLFPICGLSAYYKLYGREKKCLGRNALVDNQYLSEKKDSCQIYACVCSLYLR